MRAVAFVVICGALLWGSGPARQAPAAGAPRLNWAEVLGPAQGTLPPPRAALPEAVEMPTLRTAFALTHVKWETDLPAALALAQRENRPVFVTMRCLPCRTCSDFDRTVLEGGPDLDPLYRQFIAVRLTSVRDVDLRLLPMERFQDMDLSWWGWFLSPQGRVYGVFGGRDHVSDATRTSKPALIATMKRVLAHHHDPRRPSWNIDGPLPQLEGLPQRPVDLPGFDSWLNKPANAQHYRDNACIRCHQAVEIMRQPAIDAGVFDKQRDLEIWPLPENVGIRLERDDGLLIREVIPGSPAEAAGLARGDVLGAADARRLFSQADFRGVLHRGPRGAGTISLHYLRNGQVRSTTLDVPDGWRQTELSWRASVGEGPVGAAPGFFPMDAERFRQRLNVPAGTMLVEPRLQNNGSGAALRAAGLRQGDLILAVNDESPPIRHRAWLVWFKLKYDPGDTVRLRVIDRAGETREITYRPQ